MTGKITAQSSISSNIEPKQNKEKVITEVAMNLEPKKEDILSKLRTMINNMIKAEAFEIIPQDAKEFKNILCKIDITLFKVISSENNRHAILIIPLKINPVQDTIVVSEEKVKYLAKLRKNLLLDAYLVNLKHISSIILENLVEKGEIFYFFQNHFRNNINMNKSISDEVSLYSRAAQFKVYVNPILISDEEIQFIEKTLPFAYQRCSGIHFIHRSQLTKLLCFLEKKYRAIEEYSQEEPMYQKLEQIRCKTLKNVSKFSFPFIGFGILSVIIGVIKLDFLLPFFIEVSYGIIGIYIVLLGLLWYKYHIENKKTLVQLLTPFHQKSIKLDNASLEIIYQEFIDEDMLQFGYECFGKVTKHKLLNNIEEEKAERYDVQDVNTNYGEFFEKENSSEYNKEVDEFLNI